MKNLMIVESPNKCKKIQSILGPDWIVKASMGHVRDLPPKEMGVDLETFQPNYLPNKKGKSVISGLRKLCQSVDQVWLATDADREGEAIAWHLEQALNLKNPIRVTFNAITKQSVKEAVQNPSQIDISLVRAQEGRRVLDRLVGYSVSPALTRACGNGAWLTAGRVQSVALRIVAERELEIINFQPTRYVEVYLKFKTDEIFWQAKWVPGDLMPELQNHWTDRAFAEQVAKLREASIASVKTKKRSRLPPPPFITSTLQQAASVTLKISPKQCMANAQKLFEAGLITYHRTDNPNLSDDGVKEVVAWLSQNGFVEHISEKVNAWKAKANAQEGHEAIRPTSTSMLPNMTEGLTDEQNQLYRLIWQRTVACQMKSAEFNVTTISLLSNDAIHGRNMCFQAKGEQLIYAGWFKLSGRDTAEEAIHQDNQTLPAVCERQQLRAENGIVEQKQTKPPSRYTEASLVKKLEAEGVGRPATYASIIDNIVHRGYVLIEKRKLTASDLGILIVRTLANRFKFMELSYTSDIEDQLDQIALGKSQYKAVVASAYRVLSDELRSLDKVSTQAQSRHTCPDCGETLRLIQNKLWGCAGYPDCKYTAPNENGKPGKPRSRTENETDTSHPCVCGNGFMHRIKGRNGYFWGCTNYPTCRQTLPDDEGNPGTQKTEKVTIQTVSNDNAGEECPSCHSGQLVTRTTRKGRNIGKKFNGCTNFPNCKHFSWQSP